MSNQQIYRRLLELDKIYANWLHNYNKFQTILSMQHRCRKLNYKMCSQISERKQLIEELKV